MHAPAGRPMTLEDPAAARASVERHRRPRGVGLSLLILAGLMVAGTALRILVTGESMLADELSTYWIVSAHDLPGVVSTVHSDAEITPPLYFLAAWLTTQIDLTPEMARLPSLVVGVLTIPLVYLLGLRTVGRPAALVAAAIVSLSPFLVYYSAEARGYALMVALITLSTLTMLLGVDSRRTGWWVIYAVASCAAVYTHYTSVFGLAAQGLWVLWAHPGARRAVLLANAAAALAFVPWLSGVRADFNSPTTEILSALNPFDFKTSVTSVAHVVVGYPYSILQLEELPGTPAIVMFALGVFLGLGGLTARVPRSPAGLRGTFDRRLLLLAAIALSVPAGEAVVSAVGTNLFGGRNLASAWPAFALCLAALLVAAGPRLRYPAVALVLACFAIGAASLLQDSHERPDYRGVAGFIDGRAGDGGVIIDAAVLSPGPLSPLEIALERSTPVFRFGAPEQRERPFGVFDQVVPQAEVIPRAVAAAGGSPIYVVSVVDRPGPLPSGFPARYGLASEQVWKGTADLRVQVWKERGGGP